MSVEVHLQNRQFGNAFFRYIHARLFAEINNLLLTTPFPYDRYFEIVAQKSSDTYVEPICYYTDDGKNKLSNKIAERERKHIFLDGNWEKNEYYIEHFSLIREIIKPQKIENINYDDIVMHLRLGDFPLDRQIHPDWYIDILNRENFRKLYIVTDLANIDPSPISPQFYNFQEYIRKLQKYHPNIICNNPVDDFNFIRKFDKIIMSNGTFCYWASFFSVATKKYAFQQWHLSDNPEFTVIPGVYNGSYK